MSEKIKVGDKVHISIEKYKNDYEVMKLFEIPSEDSAVPMGEAIVKNVKNANKKTVEISQLIKIDWPIKKW
ncbi:MAG: hypothetical protein V4622_08490 [Bacteroidota bacterium]